MKKGLKIFLGTAIVLSAIACSTSSDEETKKEDLEKETTGGGKESMIN